MHQPLNCSVAPAAFDLSEEQVAFIKAFKTWYRDPHPARPFFYLDGPAGVGKTSAAKHIGRELGDSVAYVAYTGKAASVMRNKGCDGASTIHARIYRPIIAHTCARKPPCEAPPCGERCEHDRQRAQGWTLSRAGLEGIKLVIVDEGSMVNESLGRALLSCNVRVLVMGDRAQLPPIDGGGYFTNGEPDFCLTEIHRQEAGSPVIQLATKVRLGGYLRPGQYGDSAVLARGKAPPPEQLVHYDQVLCGTHVMRQSLNFNMRRALGFTHPKPGPGEKVVCLKSDRARGIYTGELFYVASIARDGRGFYEMVVKDDGGRLIEVVAPIAAFGLPNNSGRNHPQNPFDYGQAITVHKSQGSEWGSVYVVDESVHWRRDNQHFAWLYTALTRAADRVIVSL
jgi:exodeoxyribonuclease-5